MPQGAEPVIRRPCVPAGLCICQSTQLRNAFVHDAVIIHHPQTLLELKLYHTATSKCSAIVRPNRTGQEVETQCTQAEWLHASPTDALGRQLCGL